MNTIFAIFMCIAASGQPCTDAGQHKFLTAIDCKSYLHAYYPVHEGLVHWECMSIALPAWQVVR